VTIVAIIRRSVVANALSLPKDANHLNLVIKGAVFYWKGPAPHYFVSIPAEPSRRIKEISNLMTYGWGVIPVTVRMGQSEWTTSLFPKDGRYLVPIRAAVRKSEYVDEGDEVTVQLVIGGAVE
jgi:hypothetical protein